MDRKTKICLTVQVLLAVLFIVLLVMNILGYWSYGKIRYFVYAIVILAVLNTVIGLNLEKDAGSDQQN
ncbi:MAG: hypothetical protein GYA86_08875 [Firmicutes bacterium]|jgi:hypothetical protein|nr:hypothetical protein [Bacillota bacterium]